MRKDENGDACCETLGEYYDLCKGLAGDDCKACIFLKEKIDAQGRNERVIAADSQMRMLLFPMLVVKK